MMPADYEQGLDLLWGLRIPMRDGLRLHGTAYVPRTTLPVPAIFTLTPYHADTWHDRAAYFARRGYAYVLVDHRGRGNSEGAFVPPQDTGRDGHDVVEWLAQQAWCDGQVAVWGGSYAGMAQWLTLKEFPPHLKTIVPAAAPVCGHGFPYVGGVAKPFWLRWMTSTSGVTQNWNLYCDRGFWIQKYRELYLNHTRFCDFDRVMGNRSANFQNWPDTCRTIDTGRSTR